VTVTGGTLRISTDQTLNNLTLASGTTLTIDAGVTLTINGTLTDGGATISTTGNLNIAGNLTMNGATSNSSRAITFNGSGAQAIGGSGTISLGAITVNKTGGSITLGKSASFASLALTAGNISIGAFDLTVSGALSGSSASYIVTGGSGQLKATVGSSAVTFPVGNSAYNPITLTNSGTSDTYGVRIADGSVATAADATYAVNRRWILSEAVAGGSNLAVSAQYNGGEEGAAYNSGATDYIGFYDGSSWSQKGASRSGSDPYSVASASNFTPASLTAGSTYFAIGRDVAFVATPTISSFSVSTNGNISATDGYSGSTVTITGTNLTAMTAVTFGGVAATSFTVDNAMQITAIVPASAASGNIVVSSSGTSAQTSGFVYKGYITTSGASDWNTAASWLGASIPAAGFAVTIAHNLSVNAAVSNASGNLTINSGSTLTFGASGSLALAAAATLSNDGAVTMSAGGTITFNGGGTIAGANAIAFNNLTLNGATTLTMLPTINGTLTLNSATASVSAAPNYGASSTLKYNTGATTLRSFEWSAASGAGYPANVQLSGNSSLDAGGTSYTNIPLENSGNLTIDAGSALDMNVSGHEMQTLLRVMGNITISGNLSASTQGGGDIYLRGNWVNNGSGTNFIANGRSVSFSGITAQTIGGSNSSPAFYDVFINNAAGVSLAANYTISHELAFLNGVLALSTNNLTIAPGAAISGMDETRYVKTAGSGRLIRNVGNSDVFFPVGNSAYNPLTLKNAGTADNYGVTVLDAVTTPAANDASKLVNRYWKVTEAVAGGSDLSATLQWNSPAEEGSNWATATGDKIGLYTSAPWTEAAATSGTGTVTGSATYSASGFTPSDLTSGGYFGAGRDDAFLGATPDITSFDVNTNGASSSPNGYTGSVVTINGTNFNNVTSVKIGGVSAGVYTVVSPTQITAEVPAQGASGAVQVTTSNGTDSEPGFVYKGYISTTTGDWNTAASWLGASVPAAGFAVTIAHNLSVNAAVSNASGDLTVNSGSTLTFGASGSLALASAATLSNDGTVTMSAGGAITFNGSGTIAGANAIAFNNLTLNGATTLTTVPSINGTLTLSSASASVSAAPGYGASSILKYNSGTATVRSFEWSTASGAGYPANVQLSGNTTLDAGGTSYTATALDLAGNLTIDAGSTLSMNVTGHEMTVPLTIGGNLALTGNLTASATAGGDISIKGNWTNNGSGANFTNNARSISFNGTSAQTIGGSNATAGSFYDIIINNSAGVSLTAARSISHALTFSAGQLALGNNDLTMGSSAVISGASSTRFVKTAGSGRLYMTVGAGDVSFPVGNSAYNPVTLNNTGGTSDNYGVRAVDGSLATAADATYAVSRRWDVSESVSGGSNLVVSMQYNGGEEGSNFASGTMLYAGFYNGTAWTQTAATAAGSDPYTVSNNSAFNLTAANLSTGTQYFAIGKDYAFLSAPPTVTSLSASPGSGASGYVGSTVTVTGTNFVNVTGVIVGGNTVTFTSVNATTLTFTATNAAGQVVVTTAVGSSTDNVLYSSLGYITKTGATNWNATISWLGGSLPAAGINATIAHSLSVNAAVANAVGNVTVNSGITLSFAAAGSLSLASGATISNEGTVTIATGGAVTFNGSGTIAGANAITFGNLTLNGATTLTTVPTINGTLTLNSATASVSTAPNYGASSTLKYNSAATTVRSLEWSTASGAGYPANVQLSGNTTLDAGGTSYTATVLNLAGNLTIDAGSTLSMNVTGHEMTVPLVIGGNLANNGTLVASATAGGDVQLKGNWASAGTFTANGRTVTFNGTAAQGISSGGTSFAGLAITNSTANVTATTAVTASSSLTINGTTAATTRLDMGTNTLVVSGATVSVPSGALRSAGTITGATASNVTFGASGTYEHNFTTSNGVIPTATWADGSTCLVRGYTSGGGAGFTPVGINQSFYNFTWNCASQSSRVNLALDVNTAFAARNTFTVSATNSTFLALTGNPTSGNITGIANLQVTGGTLYFIYGVATNGTYRSTFTVPGNYQQSGGVVFLGYGTTNARIAVNTFNLGGSFTQSGGTFSMTNTPAASSGTLNTSVNLTGASASMSVGTGASFYFSNGDPAANNFGSGTPVLNINGTSATFSQTGGTIDFNPTGSLAGTGIFNFAGTSFTRSGGTFTTTGTSAGNGTINFSGITALNDNSGLGRAINVNVLSGATVSLQNNFNLTTNTSATPNSTLTVNSGGTLMCGTYIVSNNNTGAAGKFVNNGTLGIGDPAGITSGTTLSGNIQVTAATSARSFPASSNYIYTATANGATGNGLPASLTGNLTINAGSGISVDLTQSTGMSGTSTLTLTQGLLSLGANDLTIASTASISGGSSTSYIRTGGSGALKRTVANSNISFPVGNSAYNPLTLRNSGTSDVYFIRVADGALPSPNDANVTIDRQWLIKETTAGGSNLFVSATYNAGEEHNAASFNAGTQPYIGLYNGSNWMEVTASQAATTFTAINAINSSSLTTEQTLGLGKDLGLMAFNPPVKFTVTNITPNPATAGSGFSATITSVDNNDLPANVLGNTDFTLSSNGAAGSIGGTVTGTILSGSSSIVVSGITLSTAGTGATVTATRTAGDNLADGSSATFNVLAAADHLEFVNVPTTGTNGVAISSFTVEARRPDNTVDDTYTGTITVSKASGSGTLSGTMAVAASSGIATFSNLQFSLPDTYTLAANSGSLTQGVSGNIVISYVSAASDHFRSNGTGDWASAATWKSSPDGSNYYDASAKPTSGASSITIRSGDVVTLSSSETMQQLTINGKLILATGGVMNLNSKTGDQVFINSGGVLELTSTGAFSTLVINNSAANFRINSGGRIAVSQTVANSGGYSGFATTANRYIWDNGAIFDWNSDQTTPTSSNMTYFATLASTGAVPVLRFSKTPSFSVGSTSQTTINGKLEVNTPLTLVSGGTKTIRDGIIGTSTLTQASSSGVLAITGAAPEFGGSGGSLTLALNSTTGISLQANGSISSNITVSGLFDATARSLSGTGGMTLSATGILRTAHASGLDGTFTNSGTNAFGAGTVDFSSTSAQAIKATTYGTLTNSGNGDRTWASSGTIVVNNSFTASTGSNTVNGSTLKLASTAAGTTTFNTITTEFAGRSFYNLELVGAPGTTWQPASGFNLGVAGNLDITGAGTLVVCSNVTPNSVSIDGSLNIGAGSVILSNNIGAGTLSIGGNTTRTTGAIDATTGTVIFAGTAAQGVGDVFAGNVKNLTINNGADANVSFTSNFTVGTLLSLTKGNLVMAAGTMTMASGSEIDRSGGMLNDVPTFGGPVSVKYSGSGDVTSGNELPASNSNTASLTLNRAGNVSLGRTVAVNGPLTLTSGKLVLGGSDLSVNTITQNSTSSWVTTDGAGALKVTNMAASATQLFPVGASTSSYSPLSVAPAAASQDWSVRVASGIQPSTGVWYSNDAVQRTWNVTPYTSGSSTALTTATAEMTFQWDVSNTGMLSSNSAWNGNSATAIVNHYTGTNWETAGGTLTAGGTSPEYTLKLAYSGSFSPFAISKSTMPLPVTLLSFTGKRMNGANELKWITATESGNRGFSVERSLDGRSYTQVGFVVTRAAGGNSTSELAYSFRDNAAGTKWYYRLKQTDLDGRSKYSNVVTLSSDKSGMLVVEGVYPNPAQNNIQVRVQTAASSNGLVLQLSDMQGRIVKLKQVSLEAGASTTVSMELTGLAAGVYHLKAVGSDGTVSETTTLVKQ
jgi:hypothetical protein